MSEHFLDPRLTERRNPSTRDIDVASAIELVDLIAGEDAGVPAAVSAERESIARAVDLVEDAFRRAGRLLYVGAGTSGRLGVLDAAECPPTFGTPPEMVVGIIAGGARALIKAVEGAEDDVNAGIAAMDDHRVRAEDVVIGIAASGTTPYVRAALGRAQALGARTGLVACAEPPALLRNTCDVCIVVLVGPEVVTGSTRMKAGTATKLVLNTITTGAMIRLGKTLRQPHGRPSRVEREARGQESSHRDGNDRTRTGSSGRGTRARRWPGQDRHRDGAARCRAGGGRGAAGGACGPAPRGRG